MNGNLNTGILNGNLNGNGNIGILNGNGNGNLNQLIRSPVGGPDERPPTGIRSGPAQRPRSP